MAGANVPIHLLRGIRKSSVDPKQGGDMKDLDGNMCYQKTTRGEHVLAGVLFFGEGHVHGRPLQLGGRVTLTAITSNLSEKT
jgi:hypothetical protein